MDGALRVNNHENKVRNIAIHGLQHTEANDNHDFLQSLKCYLTKRTVKVQEADLYSTFIEVPYTQGAQVRITQCYLQITLYLPLPRKHSPDGASQTEVADI